MELEDVLAQDLRRFRMRLSHELDDLLIDLFSRALTAGERRVGAAVGVGFAGAAVGAGFAGAAFFWILTLQTKRIPFT